MPTAAVAQVRYLICSEALRALVACFCARRPASCPASGTCGQPSNLHNAASFRAI